MKNVIIQRILIVIATLSWGGAGIISFAEASLFARQMNMGTFYCNVAKGHVERHRGSRVEVKRSIGLYSSATNTGSCIIEAIDGWTNQEFNVVAATHSDGILIKDGRFRNDFIVRY